MRKNFLLFIKVFALTFSVILLSNVAQWMSILLFKKTKNEFEITGNLLLQYFFLNTMALIYLILCISLSLTFIILIYRFKKDGRLYFFILHAMNIRKFIIFFTVIFFLANIVLLFLDLTISGKYRKKADIFFNDDLTRSVSLQSQYTIFFNNFIKVNETDWLYLYKVVLDPLQFKEPYIDDLVYWQRGKNKHCFTSASYSFYQKNNSISMQNPQIRAVITNSEGVNEKCPQENQILLNKNLHLSRLETVSLLNLEWKDFIVLFNADKVFSANYPQVISFLFFRFAPFFLFPFLTIFLFLYLLKHKKN